MLGVDEFGDAALRDCEALAGAFDDEGGYDGQGERDLDEEGGAGAGLAVQLDCAADALDVGFDDIHAHASAGDGGDLSGGGEAGVEDEALDGEFAHGGEFGLGGETLGDDFLADAFDGKAAAVIGDLDGDVAAFVIGLEGDCANFGLARRPALGAGFEAVIGAVSDHVGERVADEFQDLAVDLGFSADHDEVHGLVEVAREVADEAGQLAPGGADRLHASFHDPLL